MDVVLTATVEYHYLSWKQALAPYNLSFSRGDNEKLLGLTRRRSLEVILGELRLPEEQMAAILQAKNEIYLKSVAEMCPGDLLPGANRLLLELRSAGLGLAVASASRNAMTVLRNLGIDHFMQVIIDGSMVARSKPHPDVYLKAAAGLMAPAGDCLAIEDSSHGIRAAMEAGMCVVGLGPVERVGRAHAVFPDLSAVYLEDLALLYERWKLAGRLPAYPDHGPSSAVQNLW